VQKKCAGTNHYLSILKEMDLDVGPYTNVEYQLCVVQSNTFVIHCQLCNKPNSIVLNGL
jgi:hypothetical protein